MLLCIFGCIYLFELMFSFSSDIYPRVKLLSKLGYFCFCVFWGVSALFSYNGCTSLHSHQQYTRVSFYSTFSFTLVICRFLLLLLFKLYLFMAKLTSLLHMDFLAGASGQLLLFVLGFIVVASLTVNHRSRCLGFSSCESFAGFSALF